MFNYVWFNGMRIPFAKWMIYSLAHTVMVSADNVYWHMASNADLTILVK